MSCINLSYRIVEFNFAKITAIQSKHIRPEQCFGHLSSITVYPFHIRSLVILGTLGCTAIFTLCVINELGLHIVTYVQCTYTSVHVCGWKSQTPRKT